MMFTIPDVAKNIGAYQKYASILIGSIGNLFNCSMVLYFGNIRREFMNVFSLRLLTFMRFRQTLLGQ